MASSSGMSGTTDPYYRSTYVFVSRADHGLQSLASLDDPRLRTLRIGVQLVGDDGANPPPAMSLARRGIVDNVCGYTVYGDYADKAPDTVQAVGIVLRPQRAFVALGRGNAVAEVDPKTFAIRRYFMAGQRDWGVGVAPDGSRLYTANGLSGDVSVIDAVANVALATVKVGGKPWGVVVTP
jgi:YVTN family beta-propeller protein